MTAEDYLDILLERGVESIAMPTGMDSAIIGIAHNGDEGPTLAYDLHKVIDLLTKQGMSLEEAQEFFDFNMMSAKVGAAMPIYIEAMDD